MSLSDQMRTLPNHKKKGRYHRRSPTNSRSIGLEFGSSAAATKQGLSLLCFGNLSFNLSFVGGTRIFVGQVCWQWNFSFCHFYSLQLETIRMPWTLITAANVFHWWFSSVSSSSFMVGVERVIWGGILFCLGYFRNLTGSLRMYIGATAGGYRAVQEFGKIKMSVGVFAFYQVIQVCQAEYFRQLLKPVT